MFSDMNMLNDYLMKEIHNIHEFRQAYSDDKLDFLVS